MNIDTEAFQQKIWLEAIANRLQESLKAHPEVNDESADLVVDAVIAGLTAHPTMLKNWQNSNSFIEADFFDPEQEDTTKIGSKRSAIKVSHKLPNGRSYTISGPFFNSRRSRSNG
jgi:hypothetical protein